MAWQLEYHFFGDINVFKIRANYEIVWNDILLKWYTNRQEVGTQGRASLYMELCRVTPSPLTDIQNQFRSKMITCESEDMMLIAPISWRMSSAAIVSALIRDSANATSSFRFLHKKHYRVDLLELP